MGYPVHGVTESQTGLSDFLFFFLHNNKKQVKETASNMESEWVTSSLQYFHTNHFILCTHLYRLYILLKKKTSDA